ncbi:MAG: hypothetical protein QM621_00110 [Aeromicrobium sp.]|uniref:hypothetical protein n=1 Tax=Aeromicrobium sp. TaxID=1871063 RepID=UPI0039E3AC84
MRIFPVVHARSRRQVLEQTERALELGADGVFLIDHGRLGQDDLLRAFAAARRAMPEAFLGLNLLCGGPATAYDTLRQALRRRELRQAPDALWVDDARGDSLPALRRLRVDLMDSPLADTILYGGVAFKYTRAFTEDPEAARGEVEALGPHVDVTTTSGAGTGTPPTPAKLAAMKDALGDRPLAVASGVSLDNLADYGDSIDEVLVASSVETEPYSGVFDPAALADLIAAVHKR